MSKIASHEEERLDSGKTESKRNSVEGDDGTGSVASSTSSKSLGSKGASQKQKTATSNVWAERSKVLEDRGDRSGASCDGSEITETSKSSLVSEVGQKRNEHNVECGSSAWSGEAGNLGEARTGASAGWSAEKPKPRTGYMCKICGKAGGKADSHWFQLCPKGANFSGSKNFQPPKKGYVCKLCGKGGGEPDSHWFQQCPLRSSDMAKNAPSSGSTPMPGGIMVAPYGEFPFVYAHPSQLYYMQAAMQQQLSSPTHNPARGPVSPSPVLIGPHGSNSPTLTSGHMQSMNGGAPTPPFHFPFPAQFMAAPMVAPGSPSQLTHSNAPDPGLRHQQSQHQQFQHHHHHHHQQQQQQQMLHMQMQNLKL
eukprot:CAMPEP_0184543442 /NCGR_PEP_ID=MMETSP0199_2-20130426/2940_1 /TAXON_ID=1112570 /ORGANISM="Thraustochytrium sp., Strain LLF1b" /LENGTH=364 /DNA_ID=CAMNT_0026937477 /DNA_START=452 /DNA_END=1542 /DNA_ORIENTATION=-